MDPAAQALVSSQLMGQARYIVGIDLGTTNCALAYVDLADGADKPPVRLFEIPQLVDESRIAKRPGLPSFLYLPGAHDLPSGSTGLTWDPKRDYAVGAFARDHGALIPARLVSSAKSWLCHGGVDRSSDLLPWGSPSEVPHLSPVLASSRYLQHLREAWDHEMSAGRSEWTLSQCDVVLTVPASFDEVARELTVEAAQRAGLQHFTLLEEPQAAFYSWMRGQGEYWQEILHDGQEILVCDVGGGTSDFSLITVTGEGDEMALQRKAVGDHLMLGGDNMDLALARHLEKRLVKRAGELSARQWGALVHACRQAKEKLLSPMGEERHTITLAGSGSKVIGGSLRIDLFRDEVEEIVLDGFFPPCGLEEPVKPKRMGLQELGLPYANEPAITRNLAAFLKRHQSKPDALLFNGGAMKASLVQDRVVESLDRWFGEEPEVLESSSLDLAVALGAANYGLVRAGKGIRIGGGTARSYYLGVADSSGSKNAVCLIPFGVEEGDEVEIADRVFELITDRPVSFPLYSSTAPLGHDAGKLTEITDDVFVELPSLHTVIHLDGKSKGQPLPVRVGGRLTELGTLQLWCAAKEGKNRWDLEFSLRDEGKEEPGATGPAVGDASVELGDEQQQQAAELMAQLFAPKRKGGNDGPRSLIKKLEGVFDAGRMQWPGSEIRLLWSSLWQLSEQRRHSPEHEAAWLSLAGIVLRPGFGDPLDNRRIENAWSIYRDGIVHSNDTWCRIGWWIFWRRIAGGLDKPQQLELTNKLAPPLLSGAALKAAGATGKKSSKGKKGKGKKGAGDGMNRQELAEKWRTVASLERIPATTKEGLGDVALRNAIAGRGDFAFWALGRLGARVPLYGAVRDVAAVEKVEGWLDRLLSLDWQQKRGVALAVVLLARRAGNDDRDIDEKMRDVLVDRLRQIECSDGLLRLVMEVTVLQEQEKAQLFGDTLPTGLRLSDSE
jgi:molecular chaperone DnaK (HSP70)